MTNKIVDLGPLAKIARSSELHDLKVGLTPDQADAIAEYIAQLEKVVSEYCIDGYLQCSPGTNVSMRCPVCLDKPDGTVCG